MRKKKVWLAALLIIALALVLILDQGGSRLQVQLRVARSNGGYPAVNAAAKGTVSYLNGGGDEKPVRFRDGILKLSMPYGITKVEGCFSLEDVKKAWPEAPLTEDWPFRFTVFCTNDGAKDVRINVVCDEETGSAVATMYFFYAHLAEPIVRQWEGEIGEYIAFGGLEV